MTITLSQALPVWARIGLLSFGGPAGQIALLHRELVEERGWLNEREFLSALNFCMLLPGPEAMQLATYCGWRLHGVRGGLAAGLLFVMPGALVMLTLSAAYALFGRLPVVEAVFWGISTAVVAIVFEALWRIARRALHGPFDVALAACSFLALFVFGVPFAAVVLVAAIAGLARPRPPHNDAPAPTVAMPDWRGTVATTARWLAVWLVPLALLVLLLGPQHVLVRLAGMFSMLAVVTFGGAYSVLASLGQTVVEQTGWLDPREMMDGFGLAETTPGPLILVGQFVAFLAAAKVAGGLWMGVAGSLVFLWSTFVPCFLWIFAGAPWIAVLDSLPRLRQALAAITAAVTGVILNLSLWFGLHVVFGPLQRLAGPLPLWWPVQPKPDLAAVVLAVVAGLLLVKAKAGMPKTLAFAAAAGLIWRFLIATA